MNVHKGLRGRVRGIRPAIAACEQENPHADGHDEKDGGGDDQQPPVAAAGVRGAQRGVSDVVLLLDSVVWVVSVVSLVGSDVSVDDGWLVPLVPDALGMRKTPSPAFPWLSSFTTSQSR